MGDMHDPFVAGKDLPLIILINFIHFLPYVTNDLELRPPVNQPVIIGSALLPSFPP